MERVWVAGRNIISPLGATTEENFKMIQAGKTGVAKTMVGKNEVCAGKIANRDELLVEGDYGIFESLLIRSIETALIGTNIKASDNNTVIIISSTKGEIDALDQDAANKKVNLFESSQKVALYFDNPNTPVVISNACISGSLAILMAKRFINAGMYSSAIVTGCDLISDFVTSGFSSLQAISPEPCKPFDADRKGINMGEAVATLIITKEKYDSRICITGGATSNDANHISGPSRTGEELAIAIRKTMEEANLTSEDLDFINAHGTATIFNDEMEANAFNHAGLNQVPLNSLKGYYGHTLGAAGCVESVICIESMLNNELIASHGFEKMGVSKPVNIIQIKRKKEITNILKTASGFGGCNAVLSFEKIN